MTMMGSDIARAFARRLRANADRAEADKFTVANLSTMSIADCRVLAGWIDDAAEFLGARAMHTAMAGRGEVRVKALEIAIREACDLLAERTQGSPARSAGHNARLRLESALEPAGAQEGWQPTHRHIKRGSTYRVLGEARVQVAHDFRSLREDDRLTVYQAEDGTLWARFVDEFNDGRFEAMDGSRVEG